MPDRSASSAHVMRRGAAWILAGRGANQVLTFGFGVVLARLLAPSTFGLLLTIQVFTGLAGFVAGGGMGQALVRAKAASQADFDIVFTLQLGVGCAIYAAFFVVAPWLAQWYGQPVYTDLLRVSALSFVYRPFVNLSSNTLYRQARYKAQAMAGLVTLVASSVVSIALAYLGHGVWSLVWGGLAGALTQCVVQTKLSGWRPGLSFDFRRGREIARYGFLVSANDIVEYVRSQVGVFLLSHSLGAASVGLYNKGDSLARMPFQFISGSAYPVLFRAMAAEQDNLDKCRYMYFRSIALVAVYTTPFYVGLQWLAEPLVRGVYGPTWAGSGRPLAILALAWPFWLLNNLSGAVLAATNRLGEELQIQIACLVTIVLAVLIALPYGISGVAWAIVGVSAFASAFMFRLALRSLRARARSVAAALWPAVILNGLLALVLGAASWAIDGRLAGHDLLHVFLLGGLGGLVYLACLLTLPIPQLETERARLRGRLLAFRLRMTA